MDPTRVPRMRVCTVSILMNVTTVGVTGILVKPPTLQNCESQAETWAGQGASNDRPKVTKLQAVGNVNISKSSR